MPTIRAPRAWRTGSQTSSLPRHGTASTSSIASALQPSPSVPTAWSTLRPRPDRCSGALEHPAQGDRVAGREHLPVVVEVDEALGLAPDVEQARRPLAQLAVGVVAAPSAVAVVEAHERPAGGEDERLPRALGVVAVREGDVVPAQQLVDLVAEPARVAELEAVAPGRQAVEGGGEHVVVALEPLRQLPQDRPKLGRADQRLDALVEAPDALVDVAQLLHVDEVAARLEREHELRRRLLDPSGDRVATGEAVKGRVYLDGVELRRVVLEPPRLGQPLGVEQPAPAAVLPAAAPDAHRLRRRGSGGRGHSAPGGGRGGAWRD